jgi:hypothetical protein
MGDERVCEPAHGMRRVDVVPFGLVVGLHVTNVRVGRDGRAPFL